MAKVLHGSKYGMTPCSSNAGSGYIAGSGACDAQCYTGDGGARTDCRARPSGAVAATSMGNVLDEASDAIRNASWRVWALLLPWVIVALLIVAYFVQFIFPRNPCCPHGSLPGQVFCPVGPKARCIAGSSASVALVVSAAVCGLCLYSLTVYSDLAADFVSHRTLYISAGVAGGLCLLSFVVVLALCCEWVKLMLPLFWVLLALSLFQVPSHVHAHLYMHATCRARRRPDAAPGTSCACARWVGAAS